MISRLALSMATSLLVLGSSPAAVWAVEEGSVTITSPETGATLDAGASNMLVYDVKPGASGDHVHIYIDDAEADILRELSGSYTLPTLAAGEREICVRVVNRAHVPIGINGCVQVLVK